MIKSLKNRKKKGFTLIEIMAVIAIIAILAAVLVPKVLGYFKEAKKTQVIDQARKVVTAAENYGLKKEITGTTLNIEVVGTSNTTGLIGKIGDTDILSVDDISKLKITGLNVGHCRAIIDSKGYSFNVNGSGEIVNAPTATPNP